MDTKALRTRGPDNEREVDRRTKVQRSRGRPSDFEPEMIAQAAALARDGATDADIAEALGIARQTIYVWYNRYPEFRDALKAAKSSFDERIERRLAQDAEDGVTTAQIFWLKNRRPQEWRDRRETEIIVPETGVSDEDGISNRQLAMAALALMAEAMHETDVSTIEAQANEEQNDGEEDDVEASPKAAPAARRSRRVQAPPDPDFDFE
jgi:transposase